MVALMLFGSLAVGLVLVESVAQREGHVLSVSLLHSGTRAV